MMEQATAVDYLDVTWEVIVGESFFPLLEDQHRYLILCGGRGSGKSEFAIRKLFVRCMTEGGHRFLILRKVRARCRESVVEIARSVLVANSVPFTEHKTERTLTFRSPNGKLNELLFDGLDDPLKIKSIKGITGEWIEETTEFSASDFMGADLVLREPGPGYHQIIGTFNPEESSAPWLKERFFDAIDPDALVHRSTVEDNPIKAVRDAYMARLDLIQDEVARAIYRHGIWAMAKGRIFDWDVVSAPPEKYDALFYGGDFGYSVDPAVLIAIYRRGREYWLQEMFYEQGLTNQDIGLKMQTDPRIIYHKPSYWDSAEPKSVEEIHRMGINSHLSMKGPDSVRAGIDYMRGCTIHIIEPSPNLLKESKTYRYKTDKNGDTLSEPVDFDNHAMDASRYGIYSEAMEPRPMVWRLGK